MRFRQLFQIRHQRQVIALLLGNLGGDALHLHEAQRREWMGAREAQRIRMGLPHRPPDFFRSRQFVAGARGEIGAHVIGLALEGDAVGAQARFLEFARERAIGPKCTEQETAVHGGTGDGPDHRIDEMFAAVLQPHMPELVADDGRKLRIGFGERHDARIDDDLFVVGISVRLVRGDVLNPR